MKSTTRRALIILSIGLLGFSAWWLNQYGNKAWTKILRIAIIHELKPVSLTNCEFARLGGRNDGGYIVCANLLKDIRGVYSYGIAGADLFGCDVASRTRAPLFQYDCFDLRPGTCSNAAVNMRFLPECIGPRKETIKNRPFDTLAAQIARAGHAKQRVLVKMDVEGAEWDSLRVTSDEQLRNIDQLVLEFHGITKELWKKYRLIRRLKGHFHIVTLHFNNYACRTDIMPFPAWAFQVTLVNKRLGKRAPNRRPDALHNPLSAPDRTTHPDCQKKWR